MVWILQTMKVWCWTHLNILGGGDVLQCWGGPLIILSCHIIASTFSKWSICFNTSVIIIGYLYFCSSGGKTKLLSSSCLQGFSWHCKEVIGGILSFLIAGSTLTCSPRMCWVWGFKNIHIPFSSLDLSSHWLYSNKIYLLCIKKFSICQS